MDAASTQERGLGWPRQEEKTAEVVKPVIRANNPTEYVKSGKDYEAAMQVRRYFECPGNFPGVELWIVDEPKLRKSWLSRIHLINKKPVRE